MFKGKKPSRFLQTCVDLRHGRMVGFFVMVNICRTTYILLRIKVKTELVDLQCLNAVSLCLVAKKNSRMKC